MTLIRFLLVTCGIDPRVDLPLLSLSRAPERGLDCRINLRIKTADGNDVVRTLAVGKSSGIAVTLALCAMLATQPGLAQEEAPTADAPRGGGAAISAEPVKPEGGSLQRRTNLRMPVVPPPKATGAPSSAGIAPPFVRRGADGAAARNAVGVVMPSSHLPGRNTSGVSVQAGTGVSGAGASHGNIGGVNFQRPAVPLNTAPTPHVTGINGTTMGHVASRPSSVGGPAKDRSGISGTGMRPRP